ncbi:MAG: hypothetical protein EBU90_22380 [Proteobacteria bacterium]|nr:hypothetical protein [Pseudomonadota bacterium]
MQINQSLSEFFWNEEFNVIDIRQATNRNEFSVSDYILALLLHNTFKSFDGGETFTGSIMSLLSTTEAIQYKGNLRAVIQNKGISAENNDAIVDEVRTCLQTGIDEGAFELPSENDITITNKENRCYININIIINKRRQTLVFYYDKGINTVKLFKK